MKKICGSRIFKRSMINIADIAFEEDFKVNEGCCLWKCTEKRFSQRPDAQVSIGNHEGRRQD